ncbi:hypothetical protein MHLP_02695 [Candidatus Mycoplasma haematolamae str. Purdue]|uniref:Uncharacterized protein n=1 Tax=Mycoplasma haematolamae (strain Purdue) TaxID=1212765 RepID=I7CJS7_MYCHA|nr:hypothetical protein [Candidatus Mycoplasma haematolamae]AFO52119.1 hypothetical protein MHLP_02695 [Candidatus Mycoplasma haematolamae str. Purdue]
MIGTSIAKLVAGSTFCAATVGGTYVALGSSSPEENSKTQSFEIKVTGISTPQTYTISCEKPTAGFASLSVKSSYEDYKLKCSEVNSEQELKKEVKDEMTDGDKGKSSLSCTYKASKRYECTFTPAPNSINKTLKQVKQATPTEDGKSILFLRPDDKLT